MQSSLSVALLHETSRTTSTASSLQTFTIIVTPGGDPSSSPNATSQLQGDGSKSANATMTTTLIVLGVVLPMIVIASTVFWCWYVKRRTKNGRVIERRSGRDLAPVNAHEKLAYDPSHSQYRSDRIEEWVAHSKTQRSSTTVWSDSTDPSLSTEYRPPSPARTQSSQEAKWVVRSNSQRSMATHRSDDSVSSASTEYRPPSPSLFSIAESASLYSQPSFRSSKPPQSLRSHRTGRSQQPHYSNPFGSQFPSSNYSTERHIYADSSLAVPTRPIRLSTVREDEASH